jgi:hypothetical protein
MMVQLDSGMANRTGPRWWRRDPGRVLLACSPAGASWLRLPDLRDGSSIPNRRTCRRGHPGCVACHRERRLLRALRGHHILRAGPGDHQALGYASNQEASIAAGRS